MATETGNQMPRRDSVVSSINSPEEAAEVLRGFKNALKALNSGQGYQSLAELVDQIPKLEADIREKERVLKLAEEGSKREKAAQSQELKKQLELYTDKYSQFTEEKNGLQKQNADLIAEISKKDEAIAESRGKEKELEEAGQKLKDMYKATKTKLEAKDGEITQLQQQNRDNLARVEKLTADLRKSQSDVSAAESSSQKVRQHNAQLDKALRTAQAQQDEMASYSVQLKAIDPNQLAREFSTIWVSATVLVRKFVGDDLANSTLKRSWKTLDDAGGFVIDKPLPHSNSDIAKELRVVKVLAILADSIFDHLLQPTYQPEENCALSHILYDLASARPKQERVLRGMLLEALEDQRDNAKESLSNWVVDEVMRTQGVEEVVAPEHHNEFKSSLKALARDVQGIWTRVQYSTQVFQPSLDGTQAVEFAWNVAEPQQDEATQARAYEDESAEDVVVLFPMVYLLGDEKQAITASTIVRKSMIAALFREERRNPRSVEPAPSRPRQRQRAMSVSAGARNGQAVDTFLN